jgi:hypothetical protein
MDSWYTFQRRLAFLQLRAALPMGGRRRVGQPDDRMCPALIVGSSNRQIRWSIPEDWRDIPSGIVVADPKLPRKASRENAGARTANRRW